MKSDNIWKSKELASVYLEGIRSAIPLAEEQIKVMLRVLQHTIPNLTSFLDIGCGDGVLGRALLNIFPNAKGVFLDFSEYMLNAAKEKLGTASTVHEFICFDYSDKTWIEKLNGKRFDAVVSGFSIHHQPDTRKKEIYKEIFGLLRDGGIFLNLEHVASKSSWSEQASDENFIDSLYIFHKANNKDASRESFADEYHKRQDKDANILAPVYEQLKWLGEIGYKDADVFFKVFEIALFGGIK